MKSIVEKINFFRENLELFDDDMDKYKYLLDQAKSAKEFPEEFRQESFKVDGCQAQVWLVPFTEEEKLYFHSDSDAFLIIFKESLGWLAGCLPGKLRIVKESLGWLASWLAGKAC